MKKGDKVVCINDKIRKGDEEIVQKFFKNWVKEGETYTIRQMIGGTMAVLLEEVRNTKIVIPMLGGKAEPNFDPNRFKPLDEVLESISIEEAMKEPEEKAKELENLIKERLGEGYEINITTVIPKQRSYFILETETLQPNGPEWRWTDTLNDYQEMYYITSTYNKTDVMHIFMELRELERKQEN